MTVPVTPHQPGVHGTGSTPADRPAVVADGSLVDKPGQRGGTLTPMSAPAGEDPYALGTADERRQLTAFVDDHRRQLAACLDGLTEEEARRRLVPSATTLLGLVKHCTYAEHVWFDEAIRGVPRAELGLSPSAAEAFELDEDDTIASVRDAFLAACAAHRELAEGLALDDVVTGHRFGPLTVRWVHLHLLRELAQHCGHADVLREQVLAARGAAD